MDKQLWILLSKCNNNIFIIGDTERIFQYLFQVFILSTIPFRMVGHVDLSERMIECMYEVTDRLTYHICSRKPNHRSDQHVISSDLASFLDKNELAFEGRSRLQMVCRNSYFDYLFFFHVRFHVRFIFA